MVLFLYLGTVREKVLTLLSRRVQHIFGRAFHHIAKRTWVTGLEAIWN